MRGAYNTNAEVGYLWLQWCILVKGTITAVGQGANDVETATDRNNK